VPDKKLINSIEYSSFRIWLAGFKLLPEYCAKRLLIALFLWIGYGFGIRRQVALKQLKAVYPSKPESERRSILKQLYRSMALTVYEVYLTTDDKLFSTSQIQGRENVDAALSQGRGAILATAHYGNWEAARVLPKAGIPLSVITKTQRNKKFDAYTNAIRERCGVKTIDMSRGLRDVVHQLKEGRLVAILMDQSAGAHGLMMDFLGFPASHWKGVAKLSLRYRVPIVPGFARRAEDDRIIFEFFPPILHEELEDREEHYPLILKELNSIIEAQINRWPDQWFWVHKRWKHGYDMLSN